MTYEQYLAMPEDGKRFELVEGELFVTPAPRPWHQRLIGRIHTAIDVHLHRHPSGDVYLAPIDVVWTSRKIKGWTQPDLIYIAKERREIVGRQNVQGAPDLVCEVLSPGTMRADMIVKKRAYERHAVTEYWIVFQDIPRVEVYRRGRAGRYGVPKLIEVGASLTTPLLPGFSLAIADLYQGMPDE